MKKKKKNTEFNFKEFMQTPRGSALLFFGAYFVFFVVLGIMARTGRNTPLRDDVYENKLQYQFSLNNIETNNYRFTYLIEIDDSIVKYNGDRLGSRELFSMNDTLNYYGEYNNYFNNTSGIWLKDENPYLYSEFYDVDNIISMIEKATYLSKTEYDSGKSVYNFFISSDTIVNLLENRSLDVDEVPNEIILSTDKNNYVNEIKFLLNSYCSFNNICTNSMKITLSYELCGEIDEITSPLV